MFSKRTVKSDAAQDYKYVFGTYRGTLPQLFNIKVKHNIIKTTVMKQSKVLLSRLAPVSVTTSFLIICLIIHENTIKVIS